MKKFIFKKAEDDRAFPPKLLFEDITEIVVIVMEPDEDKSVNAASVIIKCNDKAFSWHLPLSID